MSFTLSRTRPFAKTSRFEIEELVSFPDLLGDDDFFDLPQGFSYDFFVFGLLQSVSALFLVGGATTCS